MIFRHERRPLPPSNYETPVFKSAGERHVAGFLDRNHIPYVYEQPTLIYDRGRDRIWRPDFTLPTHYDLILEYAGMMDRPDYVAGIQHKIQAYARNGLTALFVCPEDFNRPDWQQNLSDRIERVGWARLYRE